MMRYAEFLDRPTFDKEELFALSQGNLVSDPPAEFIRLPAPPMLMVDRVVLNTARWCTRADCRVSRTSTSTTGSSSAISARSRSARLPRRRRSLAARGPLLRLGRRPRLRAGPRLQGG